MKIFLEAYELAKECHRKQRRRGSNDAYIKHPINVANNVFKCTSDIKLATIAILHDVIEDGGQHYYDEIHNNCNFDDIIDVLDILTYDDCSNLTKDEYIAKALTEDYRASIVKVFDRLDNIMSLDVETTDKKFISFRKYYIKKTRNTFLQDNTLDNTQFAYKELRTIIDVLNEMEKFIIYLEDKYKIKESE